MDALPDILARLRLAAGLGPVEAAEALKVDRTTLWRWEAGKIAPSYSALQSALDTYGASEPDRAAALAAWLERKAAHDPTNGDEPEACS